jgi:EAL domain-containing protein (putative c-di-GMP-specific phosphodiesterase class I)
MEREREMGAEPEGAPEFRPVLDRSTGLVVGAQVTGGDRAAGAHAFAFGPAADEGWWLSVRDRPAAVPALLAASGLPAERLVLQVTSEDLADAVATGAASELSRLGVRCCVIGYGALDWSIAALRLAPVASIQVSLAGLRRDEPGDVALVRSVVDLAASCGTVVLGSDVDTDDQLALAGAAGVGLVEGYWWGSPGSLAKLVATWARSPFSE